MAGTDVLTGTQRFTFGVTDLDDGVELVALALGLFGIAEFLRSVNRMDAVGTPTRMRMRDMRPTWAELRQAFPAMLRGTGIGVLFGAIPGTGPTITTFIAYALEHKIARHPERFGRGAIEGVAAPEAASHSKTQVDFIPTMSLGIPGDPVMALILGALMIQGIQPGPQLITEHADLFWGLIASFWIGNALLMVLNVPLIGVWVKLLQVPYRYLFPAALFFIAVGVYSTQNNLFEVWEVLACGLAGAVFAALEFPVAPILLGFVLGPMVEDNFRRALLLSHGNMAVFVQHPISAGFIGASTVLIAARLFFWGRGLWRGGGGGCSRRCRRGRAFGFLLSSIDIAPVADANHQDAHRVVLDIRDDPIVADPVFPERAEPGAFEGRAEAARIFERGQARDQEFQDPLGGWVAELVQFLPGRWVELNPPGHGPASRRRAGSVWFARRGCRSGAARRDRGPPVLQVLEDGLAGIEGLGAAGRLGKRVQALLDILRQANGEHDGGLPGFGAIHI